MHSSSSMPFNLLINRHFNTQPAADAIKLSHRRRWLSSFIVGLFSTSLSAIPVTAAERIDFIYTPLNFSIRVESLELFAKEGKINPNLRLYLRGTSEKKQAEFRKALQQKAKVDPLLLSRFFNTDIGEDILNNFGKYIKIQGGSNGEYALRGAIIQAAFDPEGLTLLNVLKKLPTNVQIDLPQVLELSKIVEIVVEATTFFSAEIAKLSTEEAQTQTSVNFSQMPDLSQNGEYGVQEKTTWILNDTTRKRKFYVDVYKPQKWRSSSTPVVIFSHGLASRPEDFAVFAKHLASYGYVVVVPQHLGSDYNYVKDLLQGNTREVFDLQEFIDRPLDISYVLDELEKRNQSEFGGKLNLKSVAAAGHSFGGYTALAVAGATIDFENLKQQCERPFAFLNSSMLLQCRALKLPHEDYNFRDQRVTSVMVFNPVNSSIFGAKGLSQIKIPLFIGAGTYDPATPFVYEQFTSFPWFTTPERYLLTVEGQAHVDFSTLDAGVTQLIESVDYLTLPSPDLLHRYSGNMGLAFFEVYLAKNVDYKPYLEASYAAYLSQEQPFKCYLISAVSSERIVQAIATFKSQHNIRDRQ